MIKISIGQAKNWGTVGLLAGALISSGCSDGQVPFSDQTAIQTTGGVTVAGTGGLPGGTGGISGTGGASGTGGVGEFPGTGGIVADTGGVVVITGGTVSTGNGEWCEALTVFRESCGTCHGASPVGAPMSIATYADTQGMGPINTTTPLTQLIGERIHNTASPMPPVSQPALTNAQKAAIDSWIAAGAPSAADPTCGGEDEPDVPGEFEWPADCQEKYIFTAGKGSDHIVGANAETHPKFTFNVPWGGKGPVQAVAIRPITDNGKVLHHWILYNGTGDAFLTGWAPGSPPSLPAPDVGIHMPEDGQVTLDVHYYNIGNNQDEPDQSGLEICITRDLRENTQGIHAFVASSNAAPKTETTNEYTCAVSSSETAYITASSPHMHQLGVHAKLEIIRAGGGTDVLHDSAFFFEDQTSVGIGPIALNNGDQVRTTCVYQNDTSTSVGFGTGSDDEMCFNFMSYYPMCAFRCSGSNPILDVISNSQSAPCGGGGFGF